MFLKNDMRKVREMIEKYKELEKLKEIKKAEEERVEVLQARVEKA